MTTDSNALIRWIKANDQNAVGTKHLDFTAGTTLSPKQEAEDNAQKWGALWNEDRPPDQGIQQYLDPICEKAVDWDTHTNITFDPRTLQRRAEKFKNNAVGCSSWTNWHLSQLQLSFWKAFSALWKVINDLGNVPKLWKHIRVVLIPKPEGGERPISVSEVMWRIGAGHIAASISDWYLQWLNPNLKGGLKGRGIQDVHEWMKECVDNSNPHLRPAAGAKIDLSKAFDRVKVQQALMVLEAAGADPKLLRLINSFYTEQMRWFEVKGFVHNDPVQVACSILQGCPLSALLMACPMTVWAEHVLQAAPNIKLGIYLDDRGLCSNSTDPVEDLDLAISTGSLIDDAFGFVQNKGKGAVWATTKHLRDEVKRLSMAVGPLELIFKLLGIQYITTGQSRSQFPKEKVAIAVSRANRIRIAVHTKHSRANHTSSLVTSGFAWAGMWAVPNQQQINTLNSAIEKALATHIRPARSRALMWSNLDLHLFPEQAANLAALRVQLERILRHGPRVKAPNHGRWLAVIKQWNWKHTHDNCYSTPYGNLDLAWDVRSTIMATAEASYIASLEK